VFKKLNAGGKLPQPVISKILSLAQGKEIFVESDDDTEIREESVDVENQGEDKKGFISPVIGLGDTASKPADPLNLEVSEPDLDAQSRRRSGRRTRQNTTMTHKYNFAKNIASVVTDRHDTQI
jgi:hypothetical protein